MCVLTWIAYPNSDLCDCDDPAKKASINRKWQVQLQVGRLQVLNFEKQIGPQVDDAEWALYSALTRLVTMNK